MMTLDKAAQLLLNATVLGNGSVLLSGISTDTRTLQPGQLFIALRGPNFDGHAYVAEALARGAVGAMVDHSVDVDLPQLIVPDTLRGLGWLAAVWRARFDIPVIAVTGSNGKTTVTQMGALILAHAFGVSGRLATCGNMNNEIGVPLTVLKLNEQHRAAVIELGMNHAGEIARLAAIARPTVALVNNAQREHQEYFASAQDTAYENGAAIAALPMDGVAVFPADDDVHAPIWRNLAGTRRVLDFALNAPAAISAQAQMTHTGVALSMATPAGVIDVTLSVSGMHNAHNAVAATACALAAGIDPKYIQSGLAAFRAVPGRGVLHTLPSGGKLIDDTYNANPDSVRAAIHWLVSQPAPTILVLGDMGEVGRRGPAFHQEVGEYARAQGVSKLLCIGKATRECVLAFDKGAQHFDEIDTLNQQLRIEATKGGTILVKGSRFMKMERIVDAVLTPLPQGAH